MGRRKGKMRRDVAGLAGEMMCMQVGMHGGKVIGLIFFLDFGLV